MQRAYDHNDSYRDRNDGQGGNEDGERDGKTDCGEGCIEGAGKAVQRANEKHQPAFPKSFAHIGHRAARDRKGGGEFAIVERDAEGEQTS